MLPGEIGSMRETLQRGLYRYEHKDMGGGVIEMEVKETDSSYIFELKKNTCRYSPGHMDMLFQKGNRVVLKKKGGKHALRFSDFEDHRNWFVLYPFRAGIPFYFERKV